MDTTRNTTMKTDPASFDFAKWEKCMTEVLNETPDLLLTEGDKQGEPQLRAEIAKYLHDERGVVCTPEQVIISAGAQQLVNHLARILKLMDIEHICTEDPGYTPVRSIFRIVDFQILDQLIRFDGCRSGCIRKLPPVKIEKWICPTAGKCEIKVVLTGCAGNVA